MIQELMELSSRFPKGSISHDAFGTVQVSIDCVIDRKGNFKQFIIHENQPTIVERLTSKKGSARLLVDKAEEVLEYVNEKEKSRDKLEKQRKQAPFKHKKFLEKIKDFKDVKDMSPVLLFYNENRESGLIKAQKEFNAIEEKQRQGNIAFLLFDESKRIHEKQTIYDAIIKHYETFLVKEKNDRFERCSICGSLFFPIADIPHGMIRWVPSGQKNGCALVSYNFKASESYNLKGNQNSSICTKCAKAYVEALNWLLTPSSWIPNEKKNKHPRPVFKNRKDISADTAVVFWLRDSLELSDLEQLDEPNEDAIRAMIESIHSGKKSVAKNIVPDKFYAITLSGVAARIAVRDWIEISVDNLQSNLVQWFEDIRIGEYKKETKQIVLSYPRFKNLVLALKKNQEKNSVQHGRVGAILWRCAVQGNSPPLWLLSSLLNRIKAEQGKVTSERIALLKLYLNRKNKQQKGVIYMETHDESNKNTAYICGSIFAVLESIQYHASGGNLNAGIRERFFSSASTTPSTAFGRLMKLTQHHLSKIRGENAGLAINLDKKMQELFCSIEGSQFPSVFSLEEQASFAIGYYHQRQKDFQTKPNNKEN